MKTLILAAMGVLALVAVAACGDDDSGDEVTQTPAGSGTVPASPAGDLDPADFSTTIDNPLYPLPVGAVWTFEGEETDPDTGETIEVRDVVTVLEETDTVAGIEVVVVKDEAFEDGELVESTLDYFAQHVDGSVYYFGERVDNYEDGELVNHDGSWLAGEGENQPGIAMPPEVEVGTTYQTEIAPGIAEDEFTVISVGETVEVEAGTYEDCIKNEDFNPLDGVTEIKYFCPGVGFVLEEFEEGSLGLVRFES
jgi:hypothetical protein